MTYSDGTEGCGLFDDLEVLGDQALVQHALEMLCSFVATIARKQLRRGGNVKVKAREVKLTSRLCILSVDRQCLS